VIGAQNVSRMCIVCGVENAAGLKGRFYELEGDELLGIFTPRVEHQGYPGRLHGGVASMVLDETMGRAVNLEDRDAWGVTLQLSVKYRKPVPLDQDIRVIARITKDSGRMFEGTGEIVLEDGTVAVEAHGKYLRLPIDRIVEGGFSSDWFADAREAPEEVEL
jgi:acyl-coenzyme A thioesterase PaaI-like protein